jgi:hypothetical protein
MLSLLVALVTLPPGEIFGDLRSGDDYLADVPLTLTCGTVTVTAQTDSTGSFRMRIQTTGKCLLQAAWKDQTAEIAVVVFTRPTRYRLVLEEQDGKLILKRV